MSSVVAGGDGGGEGAGDATLPQCVWYRSCVSEAGMP